MAQYAPKREETDSLVNSFSLVSALLLTIPFSLFGSYSYEFYDFYKNQLPNCEHDLFDFNPFVDETANQKWIISNTRMNLLLCAIPSIINLMLLAIYYICRPCNDEANALTKELNTALFSEWYQHGKYALLIMLICVMMATKGTYILLWDIVNFYLTSTDEFCDDFEGRTNLYFGVSAVFWATLLISIGLMF